MRKMSVLVSTDDVDSSEGVQHSQFYQRISSGNHVFFADEPVSLGGADEAPSPYEMLLGSLGACTSITLQMYARRKGLPLEGVEVDLDHSKVYKADCEDCGKLSDGSTVKSRKGPMIDRIERKIRLIGDDLTPADRKRLLQIANACPVHKTLEAGAAVVTTENTEAAPAAAGSASASTSEGNPSRPLRQAVVAEAHTTAGHQLVPDDPDSIVVRRALPQRGIRSCGPFVFLDHFGPVDLDRQAPVDVGPHPHIGLCTLTYLYSGAILHRDSTGAEQPILPLAANWMVAGRGVVHSERGKEAAHLVEQGPDGRRTAHGLQLWVALPREQEDVEPSFHHVAKEDLPVIACDAESRSGATAAGSEGTVARVVAGEAMGVRSPVPVHSPMFLVDLQLPSSGWFRFELPAGQEAAVYVAKGAVQVGGERAQAATGDILVMRAPEDGKGKGKGEG